MKNVGVYYLGACSGFFVYYFLLASGKFSAFFKHSPTDIGKNTKLIEKQFYFQFHKTDLNEKKWIKGEIRPDFNKLINTKTANTKIYHFDEPLDPPNRWMLDIDCIKINPYHKNNNDWIRTQWIKKTAYFRTYPYKKIVSSEVKKRIKEWKETMASYKISNSKLPNMDYNFEITNFVHTKKDRIALCDFLEIEYTQLMEDFINHYNSYHKLIGITKRTNW